MEKEVNKKLTLVLGGVRAGKSSYAQRLAADGKRVLFVATAEALDQDMEERIKAHQETRPEAWHTLEEPTYLPNALTPVLHHYDTVLLDCLTLWVSNLLLRSPDIQSARKEIPSEVEALLGAYRKGNASWIIVSNEVGLGVVPATELGRIYADELGRANQLIAAQADEVYFMAAGLPLTLKGPNHKGISPVRQAANTSDLQRP